MIKLTSYSKASGCGCKLSPQALEEILKGQETKNFQSLLVGNDTKDDAAVMELENGTCIISTVDFFTPIVNDPFDFGKVSAANAISDVYAMGGKPIMALAILGWPIEKLPAELAAQVIEGARYVCAKAGIPLAGGHSVETTEPLFGLSVNGVVEKENLKKNNTVKVGDLLYLTKPLGSGVLSAALKRDLLSNELYTEFINYITKLNSIGFNLGSKSYVHAVTDVTGFGLLGHLKEMLSEGNCSAEIVNKDIPAMDGVTELLSKFVFPDSTTRNYNAIKEDCSGLNGTEFLLLCDPQTNGGLLVSIDPKHEREFSEFLKQEQSQAWRIGRITEKNNTLLSVI